MFRSVRVRPSGVVGTHPEPLSALQGSQPSAPPPASQVMALSPDDLVATAYLATGKVAPDYEGLELSVSLPLVVEREPRACAVLRNVFFEDT